MRAILRRIFWLPPGKLSGTVAVPCLVLTRGRVIFYASLALNVILLAALLSQTRDGARAHRIVGLAAALGQDTAELERLYSHQLEQLLAAQHAYQEALEHEGLERKRHYRRYLAAMNRFNANAEAFLALRRRIQQRASGLAGLFEKERP